MAEESFIDISLEDVPELKALPEEEYQVQIRDAEIGTSNKTGGKYLLLRLEVPAEPSSKDFTHVLMLPAQGDSEKQIIKRKNRIKEAMEAFGYDFASRGGIDPEMLVGLEAWAYLTVEENSEYGTQNNVRRFVKGQ